MKNKKEDKVTLYRYHKIFAFFGTAFAVILIILGFVDEYISDYDKSNGILGDIPLLVGFACVLFGGIGILFISVKLGRRCEKSDELFVDNTNKANGSYTRFIKNIIPCVSVIYAFIYALKIRISPITLGGFSMILLMVHTYFIVYYEKSSFSSDSEDE